MHLIYQNKKKPKNVYLSFLKFNQLSDDVHFDFNFIYKIYIMTYF